MNIYAIKGHKVKCISEDDTLEKGKIYTVEMTDVGNWRTYVYLQEFPDVPFNSVIFEDVNEQSMEDNKKHSDWKRYNKN